MTPERKKSKHFSAPRPQTNDRESVRRLMNMLCLLGRALAKPVSSSSRSRSSSKSSNSSSRKSVAVVAPLFRRHQNRGLPVDDTADRG